MNFLTLGNALRLFAVFMGFAFWFAFFGHDSPPAPAFETQLFDGAITLTIPEGFEDKGRDDKSVIGEIDIRSYQNNNIKRTLAIIIFKDQAVAEVREAFLNDVLQSDKINAEKISSEEDKIIGQLTCSYDELYLRKKAQYLTISICPMNDYVFIAALNHKGKTENVLIPLISSAVY